MEEHFGPVGILDDGCRRPLMVQALPEPQGAARAQVDSPEGPVKLIDPDLLQRAIDNLVEA